MIAIIAGTGSLPAQACKNLLHKNENFFVISLFPEDNLDELTRVINSCTKHSEKPEATSTKTTSKHIPIISQPFYKPSQIFKILKDHNTKKVLLIGKVDKRNLLKKVSFDWYGVKFLASVLYKSDTSLMEKIVEEFSKHNIEVIKQDEVLDSLLVKPGILTGKQTPEITRDITFGIEKAIALSQHDIGQTVVVKDNMILSVEAIEGTDECIKRGIELGKTGVVICKAAQKNQNKKFDLPTLGPDSLKNIQKNQVKAIAWLSTHTFIAQQELFVKKAKELGITLISVAPEK